VRTRWIPDRSDDREHTHLVPTEVTFGADYTVPFVAPRITRIKPGGTAVFMLGYADMTGYGVAKCPRRTRFE